MPGCPRSEIVRNGEVAVYHCWSRCVRGAYLLGTDPESGKNYDHRKDWLVKLLEYQLSVFAVEAGGFTIEDTHLHLPVRTRPDVAATWSDAEVAWRWKRAWPSWDGRQWQREVTDKSVDRLLKQPEKIAKARANLSTVSWFMARWKEPIAKLANAEEGKKGHFWDQRFGCRELADEPAVLACMVYVDLNPVYDTIVEKPEDYDYCSASRRIQAWQARQAQAAGQPYCGDALMADAWLAPIQEGGPLLTSASSASDTQTAEHEVQEDPPSRSQVEPQVGPRKHDFRQRARASDSSILAMPLEQYLEVLDWTGRQWRPDKRGAIAADVPPILKRLSINSDIWAEGIAQFDQWFHRIVGRPTNLEERASEKGQKWFHGQRRCRDVFT